MKFFILLSIILGAALLFQNCSEGNFEKSLYSSDNFDDSALQEDFVYTDDIEKSSTVNDSNSLTVFIGDSLTYAGPWGRDTLCLNPDDINAGVGGDGTTEVLQRLDSLLDRHSPSTIVLALGVNDLNYAHRRFQPNKNIQQYLNMGLNRERSQEIERMSFSHRYRKIIQKIRRQNRSTKIVLVGVMPIDETKYRSFALNRGTPQRFLITNHNIQLVNRVIKSIAAKNNLPYVETYAPFAHFIRSYKQRFSESPFDNSGIHFRNHNNYSMSYTRKPHYVLLADLIRPHLPNTMYAFKNESVMTGCY